jgi:hypothetical protein
MTRSNTKALSSIFLSSLFFFLSSKATAAPCFPNDPEGTNPGNLCLTYPPSWSPLPNTSLDQPPFIQGSGGEAYYGNRVGPTQPGRVIGSTNGFWTGVSAVNGSTTITDSDGKTFNSQ